MQQASTTPSIDDSRLAKKSLLRAAEALGLTRAQTASIIGTRRETLSRATARLDGKQMELALLVVRTTRDLLALTNGDQDNMRHWLITDNRHLGAAPIDLMTSVEGLVRVVHYLDAMRGKL